MIAEMASIEARKNEISHLDPQVGFKDCEFKMTRILGNFKESMSYFLF